MVFNVDVLNVFNEANVLGRFEAISDANFDVDAFDPFGVTITDRQDFDRAFFDGRITADRISTLINSNVRTGTSSTGTPIFDSIQPDTRYKQPSVFQGPRTVRFGFKLQF